MDYVGTAMHRRVSRYSRLIVCNKALSLVAAIARIKVYNLADYATLTYDGNQL